MHYRSNSALARIFPQVNFKDGVFFAMLFTLRESRRTSGSTSRAYGAFIAEGSK